MRFKLPRIVSPFRATPEFLGHSGSTGSFSFYVPDRGVAIAGTVNQMDEPARGYRLMSSVVDKLR